MEINGNVSGGPNDHFEGSHDPKSFVGVTISGPRNSKAFTLSQKGTWFHGVYAYDGKVATLYLDGTAVASVKMDGAPKPSNLPLTIGDYMEGRGYAFHGKIDDIRLYNRALTEEEVKELYDL